MNVRTLAVKVAVSTITAMAAGVGSILAQKGTNAALTALMKPKAIDVPDEPVDIPLDTVEDATDESATEADVTEDEPEVEITTEEEAIETDEVGVGA